MAAENVTSAEAPPLTAEDAAARAVNKRYETLVTIRTKAIKGKGAWYWAHLEPVLVSTDAGLPKAVKLRCSLCDAAFSASNPSRTASEHLKRGSCPSFVCSNPSSANPHPKPLAFLPPFGSSSSSSGRKRLSSSQRAHAQTSPTLLLPAPPPHHLTLSGGKEDLGPLAMLEDSVKRLKSPKASLTLPLPKPQADSAISLLSDWLLESCGAVSFSSLNHPKFSSFLHQVGLPAVSPRHLVRTVLDSRYRDARADSDAKMHDALFFQLASGGWKSQTAAWPGDYSFVNLSANLPNGTAVFHQAVPTIASAPSEYAEDVLWDGVTGASGGLVERCVGIVADRFKSKALRNLESKYNWMVNLSCQVQGFRSLVNDFTLQLPLFRTVALNCSKLANFFNSQSYARTIFHKYQLQEFNHARLIRSPVHGGGGDSVGDIPNVLSMLDDMTVFARPLQLVTIDEDFKLVCLEDPIARELCEMTRDVRFWNELEATHLLVTLIMDMAREMEVERPLVGQCLPLWNDLRSKVKDWCAKFSIEIAPVEKVIERRFNKNYHPAWAAAFILDPLYLIKDVTGKYLPPFKLLTPDQEKDVDKLITRLVSHEEAPIALMELMKWRSEGLDPLYAQAVQVKQPDPMTGKMRVANPQSSRLVWETCLSEFKTLRKVAVRLIFLHATASSGFKPNPRLLRWLSCRGWSKAAMDRAQKMVFVAAHVKLERREFLSEEEKDAELFDEEEEAANNRIAEAPSV